MKICIYYNYDHTMGHPTRLWALIKFLKQENPNIQIVVLEGGDRPLLLPMGEKATLFSLPYSLSQNAFHIHNRRLLYERFVSSGRVQGMLEKRISLMKEILMDFKPDIFLTEYFPMGEEFWTFEIPLLLERYREDFHFQVVGSSGYLSYQKYMYENIQKYYDEVFVHSPQAFEIGLLDFIPEKLSQTIRRTLTDFQDKITFTGFIVDSPGDRGTMVSSYHQNISNHHKVVFVSRGGGIVSSKIIMTSCLLAQERKDLFFRICCGPATSDEEWEAYQQCCQACDNIHLIRQMSAEDFDQCLYSADICIAMSGYNTAVRLLYAQKPTVVIPHTSFEQAWRAKQMKKYIPAVVLSLEEMTLNSLSHALDDVMGTSHLKATIPSEWFLGAQQTTQRLLCRMR